MVLAKVGYLFATYIRPCPHLHHIYIFSDISANESILYHYFPNSTLDYNSVTVELVDLSEPFYMYSIQVRGHMKSCDSYLGIHVYDKTSK